MKTFIKIKHFLFEQFQASRHNSKFQVDKDWVESRRLAGSLPPARCNQSATGPPLSSSLDGHSSSALLEAALTDRPPLLSPCNKNVNFLTK